MESRGEGEERAGGQEEGVRRLEGEGDWGHVFVHEVFGAE